ncbi:MAG TPA: shikimate kinase [Opitutaceae bacterium]
MNAADVNLYLVGFMGTGKTTVGRAVSQRLGFACVDSDSEIEKLAGKTIPEIFAADGEPAFRAMERRFVESGHAPARTVVSCGGGLVIQPGMAEALRARGVVVCLHASLPTIIERAGRHNNRPLLHVTDPGERLRTLFAEREPIYRRTGTLVLTDSRPLREVVAHVIRVWEREAPEFARRAQRI